MVDAFATQRTSLGGLPCSYVGIGTFSSRAEAERMRHTLEELATIEVERLDSGSEAVYRVRLGPLDEFEADAVIARISDLGMAASVHISR